MATAPSKPEPVASPTAAPPAPAAKAPDAVKAKVPDTAAPTPAAKPAMAPATKSAPPTKAAATTNGKYTLRAGVYLLASSTKNAEQAIRKLGYTPVRTPLQRKVKMTRLKVGTFSPEEAKAKVAELAKLAPDAFILTQDGQATVYAGSYLIHNEARSFADQLYSKGVRVEEEPAMVEETLQAISFGAFSDRKAAQEAADQAKKAGLEPMIIKHR